MPINLKKVSSVRLRDVGLDEKWLQKQIREDTSLLGLGNLEILSRELRQPSKGRLDFLMRDAEADTFYEVELMLGSLDESHIIRTIEYWDIERQRRPNSEHLAVIVAEQITGRFFNIVRLLNRSVPIIAIQLSAFKFDEDTITLHAVKVLDIIEEISDAEDSTQIQQADRQYWEGRRDIASMAMLDKIINGISARGITPNITYNKHHIAIGSTGRNFAWFYFRAASQYWPVQIRIGTSDRDAALSKLQQAGFEPDAPSPRDIKFGLTSQKLNQNLDLLISELLKAEENSR